MENRKRIQDFNTYKRIDYNGYHIRIYYDTDGLDPRRDMYNLGTLYTAHRHYCPEENFKDHFEVEEVFEEPGGDFRDSFLNRYIALPVYLYDHSGVTVSTPPFHCPWDFGLFGIIAVSVEKVRKEYHWKRITTKRRTEIENALRSEIETLDQYYTGEVYGYEITPADNKTELLDSCGSFFGETGLQEINARCEAFIDGLKAA